MTKAMTYFLALLGMFAVGIALSVLNYWYVFGLWPSWGAAAWVWPMQFGWGFAMSQWTDGLKKDEDG